MKQLSRDRWASAAGLALLGALAACGGGHAAAGTAARAPSRAMTVVAKTPAVTTGEAQTPAPSPAPPDGLEVDGNRLVANGKTVRLLGVSHSGTEYGCVQGGGIFEGPTDESFVTPLLAWKVNTVRVPLNESCWLGINGASPSASGGLYQLAVTQFVKLLRSHHLYVVLDLHWNAPGTNLAKGQQPMADADHAPAFWASVASRFKDDPGVLFDLYNEPFLAADNAQTNDPWACWLHGCTITSGKGINEQWASAGMQDLVDAVRGTGATNVILLGGLAYANDLSGWLAHMPKDPMKRLAASFHLYAFNTCSTPGCWNSTVARVAAKVPVVTGEIGETDCGHRFIDDYMTWADGHGVSYLGWTWNVWNCGSGPALITDYDGTASGMGAGLKEHLAGLALPPVRRVANVGGSSPGP
jgi:hypothetical protein